MKFLIWLINSIQAAFLVRLIAAITFLFHLTPSIAQHNLSLTKWSAGPLVATNGIGIVTTAELGSRNKLFNNQLSLSLRTLKHDKEIKVQNPRFTNPKPYVYGKLNNAHILDLGFARYKTLGTSSAFNPKFQVGMQVGPSIAITKPYYVYVHEQDDPLYKPMAATQTEEVLASQESILGAANWSKGYNDLTLKGGLHFDVNLQITWDKIYRLQRFNIGTKVDYFFSDLAILYDNKNKLFATFYTTYQIGGNK